MLANKCNGATCTWTPGQVFSSIFKPSSSWKVSPVQSRSLSGGFLKMKKWWLSFVPRRLSADDESGMRVTIDAFGPSDYRPSVDQRTCFLQLQFPAEPVRLPRLEIHLKNSMLEANYDQLGDYMSRMRFESLDVLGSAGFPAEKTIRPMVVLHRIDTDAHLNVTLSKGSIEVHNTTFGGPSELVSANGDVYFSGPVNTTISVLAEEFCLAGAQIYSNNSDSATCGSSSLQVRSFCVRVSNMQ